MDSYKTSSSLAWKDPYFSEKLWSAPDHSIIDSKTFISSFKKKDGFAFVKHPFANTQQMINKFETLFKGEEKHFSPIFKKEFLHCGNTDINTYILNNICREVFKPGTTKREELTQSLANIAEAMVDNIGKAFLLKKRRCYCFLR